MNWFNYDNKFLDTKHYYTRSQIIQVNKAAIHMYIETTLVWGFVGVKNINEVF